MAEETKNNTVSVVLACESDSKDITNDRACDHYYVIDNQTKESADALLMAEEIRLTLKFDEPKSFHILFQLIKGFTVSLITEDPTKVHWDIVRAALKDIDANLLNDTNVIDRTARQLIEQCKKLKLELKEPKKFYEFIKNIQPKEEIFPPDSGRVPTALKIIEMLNTPTNIDTSFEKNNMFIWDNALLNVLSKLGPKSRKQASTFSKDFKERLQECKNGERNPLAFWFNIQSTSPENPFHLSPALRLLTKYIYNDVIKAPDEFGKKYPPALVNKIYKTVNIIHKGKAEKIGDKVIEIRNEGLIIASIPISTINNAKLVNSIFKGASGLNKVNSHRILRHLPRKAHHQRANGINPCNILDYPGAHAQLCEELNLKGKSAISDSKNLLDALAYAKWDFPHYSGNFISLGHYKSPVTRNQNLGMKITLGAELSPYYAVRQRELLSPVPKDPQLVGPTQYYANQYLLQNELMSEACNQSVRLANDGNFEISDDLWEQLRFACGLPKSILLLIKDCWTQDSEDGERFLEKIDHGIYTFGPAYHKELKFLKEQGELRKKRSQEGLRAAAKRKIKSGT